MEKDTIHVSQVKSLTLLPSGMHRTPRGVSGKVVKKDTEEDRIMHLIHEEQSKSLPLNGVVSVLDVLNADFAVMSKWSVPLRCDRWFPSLHRVLRVILLTEEIR